MKRNLSISQTIAKKNYKIVCVCVFFFSSKQGISKDFYTQQSLDQSMFTKLKAGGLLQFYNHFSKQMAWDRV